MNIALIGYGKMGKAIESIALERGHTIISTVNSDNPIESSDLSTADVAIEFTKPSLAVSHIHTCIENQIPVIVGTTGWLEELNEVTAYVNSKNGSILHSSNFSIGVNIFFEVNKLLAKLMQGQHEYTVQLTEIHHKEKLDAPSGTGITLANDIIENNEDYSSWVLGREQPPHTAAGQIAVTAIREEGVPGTHTLKYVSDIDSITIEHEAHNRKGFALGAVIAAEWLYGKTGVFTMKDVLNLSKK
jgi:4-hydroxy-tetrahydrodipicolinate reductase